jgi:hypothetical protein
MSLPDRLEGMTFDRLQLDLQLKDVRRLTREDMKTDRQLWRFDGQWQGGDAYQGMRYMREMGLAMYEWHGYHMVGFADAAQHPHDRWLYRTSVPIGAKAFDEPHLNTPYRSPSWVRLSDACVLNTLSAPRDVPNLTRDMQLLLTAVRYARSSRNLPFGDEAETTRELQLLGAYKFPGLAQPLALRDGRAYRLAHEMLHHYDTWQAKIPQAAGLPRDIVARMYGLGGLVDAGMLA